MIKLNLTFNRRGHLEVSILGVEAVGLMVLSSAIIKFFLQIKKKRLTGKIKHLIFKKKKATL